MAVDPELLELMDSLVVRRAKTGQDKWQNPMFSSAEQYRCMVEAGIHTVKDTNGVKREAIGKLYLERPWEGGTEDELTVDGVDFREIIRVDTYQDDTGPYMSVVHYG